MVILCTCMHTWLLDMFFDLDNSKEQNITEEIELDQKVEHVFDKYYKIYQADVIIIIAIRT